MCGRFALFDPPDRIRDYYRLANQVAYHPSYNIPPQTDILAVVQQENQRMAVIYRWGLLPVWSKDFSKSVINARIETLNEKPLFKKLIKSQRCIIPANGFYEWKKEEHAGKIPFYIQEKKSLLSLGGIYSYHPGLEITTTSIITVAACKKLENIHTRMPLMLKKEVESDWLNPEVDISDFLADFALKETYPDLAFYPVSSYVNNARNNSPNCIRPENI